MSRSDHMGGVLTALFIGWMIGLVTPDIMTRLAEAWLSH